VRDYRGVARLSWRPWTAVRSAKRIVSRHRMAKAKAPIQRKTRKTRAAALALPGAGSSHLSRSIELLQSRVLRSEKQRALVA
jgi:hypothetical protein